MESIVEKLVTSLRSKTVDSLTAAIVLQEAVKLARHEEYPRAVVEETLLRIAAGADGITGTADDIIPPQVVNDVIALLKTGLVGDLVDILITKARGWCCFRM